MWVNQSVTYVGELDHHRVHREHREKIYNFIRRTHSFSSPLDYVVIGLEWVADLIPSTLRENLQFFLSLCSL